MRLDWILKFEPKTKSGLKILHLSWIFAFIFKTRANFILILWSQTGIGINIWLILQFEDGGAIIFAPFKKEIIRAFKKNAFSKWVRDSDFLQERSFILHELGKGFGFFAQKTLSELFIYKGDIDQKCTNSEKPTFQPFTLQLSESTWGVFLEKIIINKPRESIMSELKELTSKQPTKTYNISRMNLINKNFANW